MIFLISYLLLIFPIRILPNICNAKFFGKVVILSKEVLYHRVLKNKFAKNFYKQLGKYPRGGPL